jgi:hypothetical protein
MLLQFATQVATLKRDILRLQLTSNLKIALPPTFINHTINEIDELIHILSGEHQDEFYHLNQLWLNDAQGHADFIMCNLDPTEHIPRKQFKKYKKMFKEMVMMNLEEKGYSRAISQYPRKEVFATRINDLMREFITSLASLRDARLSDQVIGAITARMVNHMLMEELYYMEKLGLDVANPTSVLPHPQ